MLKKISGIDEVFPTRGSAAVIIFAETVKNSDRVT
jgi:hypothetical protein